MTVKDDPWKRLEIYQIMLLEHVNVLAKFNKVGTVQSVVLE